MPATFLKGDLFNAQGLDAIAHGCNCAGVMGKGIAVEFKKRYPDMFAEYRRRCRKGQFTLGDVFMWENEHEVVFNLATQRTWRTKAELDAIREALQEMICLAENTGLNRIGLPRIGAGLGGLPWEHVRDVIAEAGARTTVELVVFEEYVAKSKTTIIYNRS